MTNNWQNIAIKDLLDYERPDNYFVKSENYIDNGTPVLTANKSFILGYTSEESGIYDNLPVIIFDDFTTDSKYVDFPFKVKSSAIKILKAKNKDVDLKFVYETMKSIVFPTGAHKRYYISQYQNMVISVPTLPVQKKVSAILSSLDEAIHKTDQIIRKSEELKNGLMNELLTKGIGHSKFKKTKLGEIPEGWRIISLSEIVEKLEAGVSVNSEDKQIIDGEFGILKTSAVTYGFFDPSQHKRIIDKDLSRARVKPLKDRLIISRMNTPLLVGASAYVDKDYNNLFLPDRLWQIELIANSNVSAKWLSYQFAWLTTLSRIRELASGTSASMKNISKQKLLTLEIAIPPYREQVSITELLQSVDNKNNKEKKQMNNLKQIKNGLMHDIFNHKVQIN